jgi:membrane protein implicated in regulation of membrane protease activity
MIPLESHMELLWWHWLVVGLLLVLVEVATPGGFFVIFFGVAAIIIGALAGLGLAGPVWMQLLMFSVLSVVSLALFRARLLKMFQHDPQAPEVDSLVGEIGQLEGAIAPGQIGRIEVRGTAWSARNATALELARGMRCRVVRVNGLMLEVEPEGARS